MSGTNQTPVMDVESAYALVSHKVYAPVFFSKLASDYGIRPKNAADAQKMLHMAASLREGFQAEEKQAAAAGDPLLDLAQQHLQNSLGARGLPVSGFGEDLVEKAAAQKSLEPDLAHAILSLSLQAPTA